MNPVLHAYVHIYIFTPPHPPSALPLVHVDDQAVCAKLHQLSAMGARQHSSSGLYYCRIYIYMHIFIYTYISVCIYVHEQLHIYIYICFYLQNAI